MTDSVSPSSPVKTQPSTQAPLLEDSDIWGTLEVLSKISSEKRTIQLKRPKGCYVIGRQHIANVVDLPFPEKPRMSGIQCSFTDVGCGAIRITDLGSTNGTWVNNVKLSKARKPQSMIVRGSSTISFGWCSSSQRDEFKLVPRHRDQAGCFCGGSFAVASQSDTDVDLDADVLDDTYQLLDFLGVGGLGQVRKVLHGKKKEVFAIKFVNEGTQYVDISTAAGRQLRQKPLQEEIDILKQLCHPNIVGYKDEWRGSNGRLGLIMEFMPGGDLHHYIRHHSTEERGLREWKAKYFTRQICDALVYLHGKRIVHRDLKPNNVLLTDGDPPIAKLADFNLAKTVLNTDTALLSNVCGTDLYMAPEIKQGKQYKTTYDKVVDSYSLGVTLLMMLWGQWAYRDPNAEHKQLDMKRLQSDQVSLECRDFNARLLRENPRSRMTAQKALEHRWLAGAVWRRDLEDDTCSWTDQGDADDTATYPQKRSTKAVSSRSEWQESDFLLREMKTVEEEPASGTSQRFDPPGAPGASSLFDQFMRAREGRKSGTSAFHDSLFGSSFD
ncbi:kinase-like protein [Lentinus tigrinus ALCF2SS1-7]|uniref:Kinase-like protein n=1 Tax=Lentinus tigrinus ALCF2SS1-6 TaxID=1328759 RepID=A0A5C2S1G5_9APHY|nr:kinase-like protein [Lentinus tigrinus ALCF2SS1-6]RPD73095.1 kinase-like protein [Lentinus tigrinus ALCF2SS1-7]